MSPGTICLAAFWNIISTTTAFVIRKRNLLKVAQMVSSLAKTTMTSLRGKRNKDMHKYSQLKGAAALSSSTLVSLSPWAWWPHLYPVPGQAHIEYISLSFPAQFSLSAHQYVHAHAVFMWVPILDHIFKKERESGKNREKNKDRQKLMGCLPVNGLSSLPMLEWITWLG